MPDDLKRFEALPLKVQSAMDVVRQHNDKLGQYSDHEGNESGSTFYFWDQGKDSFEEQCERAIEDHKAAITAWRKIRRLNRDRV